MNTKKKFLASFLAVVMAVLIVGLPSKAVFEALASTNVTLSTESLVINNVSKTYDLETNNKIFYADYVDGYNPTDYAVAVFSPNGTRLTQSESDGMTFTEAGLHAVLFSKESSAGHQIYADVIYIPVASAKLDGITLDGSFVPMVLPASTVQCPKPIDENGDEDTAVSVKVFTPYGEEISAVQDSINKRWSFTNKANILGKYFVEYTKTLADGKIFYKYLTIEFSTNANTTVSTNYYEDSNDLGESVINIDATGLNVKDESSIYLYKYYNIQDAIVKKADGTTDNSAQIYLTIYDEDDKKFYNYSTGKFDILTSTEARKSITDPALENFNLSTIEHFSALSGTGHSIKFTYSATVDGKELTKIKTLKEAFNDKVISLSTAQLNKSEIRDIVIVDEVTTTLLGAVTFEPIKIEVEEGYDLEAIKKLVKSVNVKVTPRGESSFESSKPRSEEDKTANKVGFDVLDTDDLFVRTYTFHYNKNVTGSTTWALKYTVSFGTSSDSVDGIDKNLDYTLYVRQENEDKTSPSKLTISGGGVVSTDGTYKVPTATVEDTDDNAKTTTGAEIEITLVKPNGSTEIVEQGQELTGLTNGTYTLNFVATDYAGNTRTKTVTFKVKTSTITDSVPILESGNLSYDYVDGRVVVTLDSNADGVIIYSNEKGQFSPEKMTFEAGRLTGFEFVHDGESACMLVLKVSNSKATSYRAVKLFDGDVSPIIRSIGYAELGSNYARIIPNTVMEAKTGQKLFWFGSNSFEIEAPENSVYKIFDGNEIVFYTSGEYKITSREVVNVAGVSQTIDATTTITVKASLSGFSASLPIGNKLVAKKGEVVELNRPLVSNYYGYEVKLVVRDSAGRDVTTTTITKSGEAVKFVAPKNDEYTVTYTFTGLGMVKLDYPVVLTTGNVDIPQISISENNANVVWEGEKIRYQIKNATAVDKNGVALPVSVKVFDQYGKELGLMTENGNHYVDITGAGFYTVRYSAVDADGQLNVVEAVFAVEFPEDDDENKLSAWAVIGIVFASVVGACGIALLVMFILKHNKKKTRFINKSKQIKKQEKKEVLESIKVYTIAESKDEKHWLAKAGNRTIAKVSSKQEAIEKIKETHKKGEYSIKVYNKNGRLIDSI